MSLLIACGEGSNDAPIASAGTPTQKLLISPSSLILAPGNTQVLHVQTQSGSEAPIPWTGAVQWRSDNPALATVDEHGQVRAIAEGTTTITAQTAELSAQIVATIASVATVQGTARFEDKLYNASGQTGSASKTLRYVKIEAIGAAGNSLGATHSDENGNYTLTLPVGAPFALRLFTSTESQSGVHVEVRAPSASREIFAVVKGDLQLTTQEQLTIDLDVSLASELDGAFSVLDALTSAVLFARELTAQDIPLLQAYWSPSGSQGTFYCNKAQDQGCVAGSGIYVLNQLQGATDADHFDDDVLWHEFGHFMMDHFARDDSPGGYHAFTANDLDLRLAWSEGWGNYFSTAVKTWLDADDTRRARLSAVPPLVATGYVDTAAGRAVASIDFGNPGGSRDYLYASNEVAIAKVLIETEKRFGLAAVWAAVTDILQQHDRPATLEVFWDNWREQMPQTLVFAQSIFAERAILYQKDHYEADDNIDSARDIKPNTKETHTLYGDAASDVDYFSFYAIPGTEYTLWTSELRNGADTQLRLFSQDGAGLLAENDDAQSGDYPCGVQCPANDGVKLASRLVFKPALAGQYYFAVSTTLDPNPYPSAGRYGTYTVNVSAK